MWFGSIRGIGAAKPPITAFCHKKSWRLRGQICNFGVLMAVDTIELQNLGRGDELRRE